MGIHIGEKILRKRQELGLTQSELARRAGIAQSTLSNIEKGKKRPQFDTMSAVCRVLGLSILELLTYEEQPSNIRIFEETMAAQDATPGGVPEESAASRLMAFDRYLYDLFIAQTGAPDPPADASISGSPEK